MRVSNRAEAATEDDARGASSLPGAPFHSFARADARPLRPGLPERVRFELLPTAYSFAPVWASVGPEVQIPGVVLLCHCS